MIEECFHYFFFFQAEDGIRDDLVTGVQTCALPIFVAGVGISTLFSLVIVGGARAADARRAGDGAAAAAWGTFAVIAFLLFAGGDRERRQVARHDRVGADHAAVADADAAGDHDVRAAPHVGADPRRPLAREALP